MELLYALENIRFPALTELMLLITQLGEETFFLLIALTVFWCVNKREGYCLLTVGFLGTILNQFLKLTCRIPRPWVQDPTFQAVEEAIPEATGYSFPSGHTQSAVGTFGSIACWAKRNWVRVVCIVLLLLVSFSRMYLGVHTPLDVGVSFGIAVVLSIGMYLAFRQPNLKISYLLLGMFAIASAFVLFVELYSFPADIDPHNLESGIKNAYTLFGAAGGICVAEWVDRKKTNFTNDACWWAQILKLLGGVALVLGVKILLKSPLNALFAGHQFATAVRYFLMVIVAGVFWPMTFGWFSRLGKKNG